MPLIEVQSKSEYDNILKSAGSKLVVVDFTATWCGPCQMIAPVFKKLSVEYPQVSFLKVDVDKCQDIAKGAGVSSMPTFHFYKLGQKVDSLIGANAASLQQKVKTHAPSSDDEESSAKYPAGQHNLKDYVATSKVTCLNESKQRPVSCIFKASESSYLESDCDEQLIVDIPFNQTVKLHSLIIKSPQFEFGPLCVKLYINRPSLGFDDLSSIQPVQELSLTRENLEGGIINLRYVKFQYVNNIMIAVETNQGEEEVTRISSVELIGQPVETTNMNDFNKKADE